MVFTIIILGLFLSFAAAAIDMGNIYLWKLRLDKAARAGVLSGLGYRSMRGWQSIYSNNPESINGGEPEYTNRGNDFAPKRRTASDSPKMRELLQETHQVVVDNFKASFPPGQTPNLETLKPTTADYREALSELPADAYNPVLDELEVSYMYDVPTFLVGRASKVLGFSTVCGHAQGGKCRVTTTQRSQLDYANIILLLDVSGSMNCEVGGRNCACRNSATTPCGANGTGTVLDILRPTAATDDPPSALEQFYTLFNPFRDRIAVIPFNMAATVSFGFSQQQANGSADVRYAFGASYQTFNGNGSGGFLPAITNLTAASNTNPCDAFIQAIGETNTLFTAMQAVNNALQQKDMRPFVVLFSDGAPNAMRGVFENITAAARTNSAGVAIPNDWYHFALEWVTLLADGTKQFYTGPSPLINTSGASLFDLSPTDTQLIPTGATNSVCGGVWYNRDQSTTTTSQPFFQAALDSRIPATTPGCLTVNATGQENSLQNFLIPNTGTAAGVAGVPPSFTSTNVPGGRALTYDSLPYYCTIEAADYMRRTFGATVYSIGLGTPDLKLQTGCPDPLQDTTDSFVRKDNFLSRVAFDPVTVEDPNNFAALYKFSPSTDILIPAGACDGHRYKGDTIPVGYTPASGINTTPQSLGLNTQGRYYATNNPRDLPLLFSQVAKQILLRLTS